MSHDNHLHSALVEGLELRKQLSWLPRLFARNFNIAMATCSCYARVCVMQHLILMR